MAHIKKPIPQKSEETLKEERLKSLLQKRVALAEGVLFNLCQNPGMVAQTFAEPGKIAEAAVNIADALMEKLFVTKE